LIYIYNQSTSINRKLQVTKMRLRGSRVRPRRRKRRLMSLCWRFRNWKRREISTMLIKRAQAKNFKSLRLSSKKMRRLFWLTKRSSRQA